MAVLATPRTTRPAIMGNHFMVAAGHYLATMAAIRILEMGGNAIDAGVAGGLCINVLQPDLTSLGGVAPIILYSAKTDEVRTISGLGHWPQAATREYFADKCNGNIPRGLHRSVIPAAIDSWLTALEHFGTMSFADVAAPARALADNGFPIYPSLQVSLAAEAKTFAQWPSSAEVFLAEGRVPRVGEQLVQRDLGRTLQKLVEAEAVSAYPGRKAGIHAARDRFYKGDIAEQIAAFFHENGGFLTFDDLKDFRVDIDTPVRVNYRGYDVHGCRPWCQGPVALETLSILEGYDLASLRQQPADALHLVLQSLNAAFADRERYYGDPKFVDVPVDGLLHPQYSARWRDRISLTESFPGMPEPGSPWDFQAGNNLHPATPHEEPRARIGPMDPDTSYLCVIDDQGNAFSATPSDVFGGSPVVSGLGFVVSNRGTQSWTEANHPSAIAPGKRPRLTPSPGLIMRDGNVFTAYGTPGNDVQPQAMVQFVVNLIDFGMDPQAAIEAPRVASYSFPGSSHPHPYHPGLVRVEGRIADDVIRELMRRGHNVERWQPWDPAAGSVCTVVVDRKNGSLIGGADPRRVASALGW